MVNMVRLGVDKAGMDFITPLLVSPFCVSYLNSIFGHIHRNTVHARDNSRGT